MIKINDRITEMDTARQKLENIIDQTIKPILKGWEFGEVIIEDYYDEPNRDGEWISYEIKEYVFYKKEEGFIKVINIQPNEHGSGEEASFTLETGIKVPDGLFFEDDSGGIPFIAGCLRKRIGDIMDMNAFKDHNDEWHDWYYLEPETDLTKLADIITRDFKRYVLPYFDKINNIDQLISICIESEGEIEMLTAALLLTKRGDKKGGKIFKEVYSNSKASAMWKIRYKEVGLKYGIRV